MTGWRIAVGEDLSALDALDGATRYAFQSSAWLSAWTATLGRTTRPLIVTVTDTRLRLVLPLGLTRQRGLRIVAPLGGGVTDYHAPVVDPAFAATLDEVAVASLWTAICAALPPHDLLRWPRLPATMPGDIANPFAHLPGMRPAGEALGFSLPPPSAPLALRPRFAKRLAQYRRQASRIGPVTLDVVTDPGESRKLVDALIALKGRRWRETGAPDGSADLDFVAFYRRIAATEQAHLSRLRCGDAMLAAHLGIVDANTGRFYFLMIGWAAGEWRRFSPGLLILQTLAEEAAAAGLALFDLTVGDEAYKREWADVQLPLLALDQAASLRGRLALGTERTLRAAREHMKRITWLRAAVRGMAGRRPLAPDQAA